MSNRDLTITVKAKNQTEAGLKSASNSVKKFGSSFSVGSLAKFAGWIGAAQLAVKTMMSFGQEVVDDEKAAKGLENVLNLYGEAGSNAAKGMAEFASKLESMTGVQDDVIMASMTEMRLMGVRTDKLQEASKAVVALSRAGMGEEKATRAITNAYMGNYEALTRYIPALKNANSEAEKAQIVNDFLTKQFKMQGNEINTLSGKFNLIKIAWNNVGTALNEKLGASDKISGFMSNFRAGLVGIANLISGKELTDGLFPPPDTDKIKIAAQDIAKIQDDLAENAKKIADEQSKLNERNHQEVIEQNQKEIDQEQEKAKSTIAAIMDKNKSDKESKDLEKEERAKYDKLLRKNNPFSKSTSRHTLSKRDQEFMKAFEERERARGFIGGLQGNIDAAQQQMKAAENAKLEKPLNDLVKQGDELQKSLKQLLAQG